MREAVTAIESVLRRDRLVLGTGLAVLTLLAWSYLAYLAWDMQHMDMSDPNMDMNMAMPTMRAWRTAEYVLMFIMWAVMMIAMMVPSAAPMILMFMCRADPDGLERHLLHETPIDRRGRALETRPQPVVHIVEHARRNGGMRRAGR